MVVEGVTTVGGDTPWIPHKGVVHSALIGPSRFAWQNVLCRNEYFSESSRFGDAICLLCTTDNLEYDLYRPSHIVDVIVAVGRARPSSTFPVETGFASTQLTHS